MCSEPAASGIDRSTSGDDAVGSSAEPTDTGVSGDEARDEYERPETRERESAPALVVDGLSKTFGSGADPVVAVEDVSFAVDAGEVVGLLGPNGAGKTTTIKSVLGLVLPDSGTVRIRGVDVYDRPRAAYGHVDAMLEGARNDYWRLTVRENLRYFAAVRGRDPDALADRHDELLERFGLADRADAPVRDLSRGMKQKVSLASALAGDVSVVFLDEPTLGLDVESSLRLRRELRSLAAELGLTLVVSSHDMDVIEAVCDRVIIMNEGRIVVDDTVENLLAGFETQGYRFTVYGVDDAVLADLRDRFEARVLDRLDDRARFEVAADSNTFYRVSDALERHGLEVGAVDTVQPDLAEAFVEVTGSEGDP